MFNTPRIPCYAQHGKRRNQMNKNLNVELKRVKRLIAEESKKISQEASNKGMRHSGLPIQLRVDRVPRILESELMPVVEHFYKADDLEQIKQFVNQQRVVVERFTSDHLKVSSKNRDDGFEQRIEELKGRLINRQKQVRKQSRHNKLKTWGPIVLALAAVIDITLRLVL